MKLLFENWRDYLKEAELYGNCGMVAIAMVREAQQRGIGDVKIIIVSDAEDQGTTVEEGEDFDMAHVVVGIGDRYFDDRGEIKEKDITTIPDPKGQPQDLLDPHMAEVFRVTTHKLTPSIEASIQRNTNHTQCPTDFEERAAQLLDKAGYTA